MPHGNRDYVKIEVHSKFKGPVCISKRSLMRCIVEKRSHRAPSLCYAVKFKASPKQITHSLQGHMRICSLLLLYRSLLYFYLSLRHCRHWRHLSSREIALQGACWGVLAIAGAFRGWKPLERSPWLFLHLFSTTNKCIIRNVRHFLHSVATP